MDHLRRVWHDDRARLLLRAPGPVPLGLAYVLLVETNPFPNLSLFYRTMLFEYPSVLSRVCLEPFKTFAYVPQTEKNAEYYDTREREENGQQSETNMIRYVVFLYSYLIILVSTFATVETGHYTYIHRANMGTVYRILLLIDFNK